MLTYGHISKCFVVVDNRLIDDAIVLIMISNICNLQINVTIDQDEKVISVMNGIYITLRKSNQLYFCDLYVTPMSNVCSLILYPV